MLPRGSFRTPNQSPRTAKQSRRSWKRVPVNKPQYTGYRHVPSRFISGRFLRHFCVGSPPRFLALVPPRQIFPSHSTAVSGLRCCPYQRQQQRDSCMDEKRHGKTAAKDRHDGVDSPNQTTKLAKTTNATNKNTSNSNISTKHFFPRWQSLVVRSTRLVVHGRPVIGAIPRVHRRR
jgi:hypothetical protein